MKIFTFVILNIISIGLVSAQQEASNPKNEFNIELSNNKLEIKPGEEKDITVKLIPSKSYAKLSSVMGLSSMLPEGVHIVFEPSSGIIVATQVHVKIDESVKPGSFTIIINCTMNHKNKGAMLKLIINESSVVNAGL
jgi:hypothetical protein